MLARTGRSIATQRTLSVFASSEPSSTSSASCNVLRYDTNTTATPATVNATIAKRGFSSFQPPPNNVYHGTPVYNNINISNKTPSPAATARNNDPSAIFVVTGASRSMGLQFVKELLSRTQGRIIACVLRPGSSPALDSYLNELSREVRSRVEVHGLDVTKSDQMDQLVDDLTNSYGRVDGLFNVAGVLGDKVNTAGPEMKLAELDGKWLQYQMEVNAIGPMMLTAKLAPLLKARKGRNNYLRETGAQESVVVNLSARVASSSDNTGGLAWHSYRMSKAALTSGVRSSSHELKRQGTWTIALYPGMTDTDMSKPFQSKMLRDKGLVFPVEFSVGRLMDVVDGMEEADSGGLFDWAGQAIPF